LQTANRRGLFAETERVDEKTATGGRAQGSSYRTRYRFIMGSIRTHAALPLTDGREGAVSSQRSRPVRALGSPSR
jgi:hypothetical protein